MDDIAVIVKRLDEARRKLGLNHKDLGDILGVTKSSIGSAFSRKSMKISKIKLLANELNINYFWLTTGKGEMFIQDSGIVNENNPIYNKANCRKCIDKDIIIEFQNNVISTKDELINAKDEIIESLKRELELLRK